MKVNLPLGFIDEMKALLGSEFEAFLASFQREIRPALRPNERKITEQGLQKLLLSKYPKLQMSHVPWTQEAFYYERLEGFQPGKLPAYLAGLFYIQEASAMLPAQILRVPKGGSILDMCAAPGGKTSKLANLHQGNVKIFANDIQLDRSLALLRNVEQLGLINVVVLHEDPKRLLSSFYESFEGILIDAPCSGEGMMRRDPKAMKAWTLYKKEELLPLQASLLAYAAEMLKPGGELLYSTCTFNLDENEKQILRFLSAHTDFEVLDPRERLNDVHSVSQGCLCSEDKDKLARRFLRIWPHRQEGDGHFLALMRKKAKSTQVLPINPLLTKRNQNEKCMDNFPQKHMKDTLGHKGKKQARFLQKKDDLFTLSEELLQEIKRFMEEHFEHFSVPYDRLVQERDFIHLPVHFSHDLQGFHVLKRGLCLLSLKELGSTRDTRSKENKEKNKSKKRTLGKWKFQPSHSLALAYGHLAKGKLSLKSDEPMLKQYLGGQSLLLPNHLNLPKEIQYLVVEVDGYPLGWCKIEGQRLKNLYPSSWLRFN